MTAPVAVVLMAYGTPGDPSEIEAYYTDIRRGRPPTPEALADLTARYVAIGGVSPLAEVTDAQRHALQRSLDERAPGRFVVSLGMKHADPKVEEAAGAAVASGAATIVGLVLAPHYSSYSIGEYLRRCRDGAGDEVPVIGIESWATEPAFVEFLADDLGERRAAMTGVDRSRHQGVVHRPLPAATHHRRWRSVSRPAPLDCRCGRRPPRASRKATDWSIAWQSAGRTPEPWIGPDILQVIDELAALGDVGGVIVCAVRFRGRPPRGAVRPRHRGRGPCRPGRPGVRPHGERERRPRRDGGARRAGDRSGRRRRHMSAGMSADLHMSSGQAAERTKRIVVVGGGIAGLAAGFEVATASTHDVTVLEAADRVGGRIDGSPVRRSRARRVRSRCVPGPRAGRHRSGA